MYPLNVQSADGFAVANTDDEHRALTAMGYLPALVEVAGEPQTGEALSELDRVRAQLDAAGVTYDKRLGLAKLKALL